MSRKWGLNGVKSHTVIKFKVDRLQIIVVAKNITVLQLFISRMPKMCAIPQLVSAPLNPIPTVEHFRRSLPQCEHSYTQHIHMSEEKYIKLTNSASRLKRNLFRIRVFLGKLSS